MAYKPGVTQAVPNSAGTEPPRTQAPLGAADCHIHIYDPRFAPQVDRVTNATASDYRLLQKRLGLSRVVIVQPRNYQVDNAVTLDAIAQLGQDKARGIAVVRPDVADAELERLNAGGIRGIRFTVANRNTAVVSVEMIEPLARRIATLGWHVQLNMPVAEIVANRAMLQSLPTPIVFDHLGNAPAPDHPGFEFICDLAAKGRAWVKVSGAYLNSETGAPGYPEATRVAQAYVRAIPRRLVWGSDWPHPSSKVRPDTAQLFDLLAVWAPDETTRNAILVTNPEALYGFPESL
jgi:predicted TIM-barrel fold metal-dependent hydrolase